MAGVVTRIACAALPGHMHGIAVACGLIVQAQIRHQHRHIVLIAIAVPLPAASRLNSCKFSTALHSRCQLQEHRHLCKCCDMATVSPVHFPSSYPSDKLRRLALRF